MSHERLVRGGKKALMKPSSKSVSEKKKSLRSGLGAGKDHLGKHRSDVTNPDFELQIGEEGGLGASHCFPPKRLF